MYIFTLSYLCTVVAVLACSQLPSIDAVIVFGVVLAIGAMRFPPLRVMTAGLLLGVCLIGSALWQVASQQLHPDQFNDDHRLVLRITGVPERQGRRQSFEALVEECLSCDQHFAARQLRLSWYGHSPMLRAGERWSMTIRVRPMRMLRSEGAFDAVAWAMVHGFDARGYVRDAEDAERLAPSVVPSVHALRQSLSAQLQSHAPDAEYAGLIQALSLGLKGEVSDSQWALLRETGTAHLLAISGLHVGLIFGWVLLLGHAVRTVFLRLNVHEPLMSRRWYRAIRYASDRHSLCDPGSLLMIIALAAATAYGALAGFHLPVQRALIMLAVYTLAAIRFRCVSGPVVLCTALLAVLISNPLNPLSAGFWLSVGTVALLMFLHSGRIEVQAKPLETETQCYARHADKRAKGRSAYRIFKGRYLRFLIPVWQQKLKPALRTHVLLGLVLVPITAWFFQSGSLIAPLANLIAVPFVGLFCVPLSVLSVVLSTFWSQAAVAVITLTDALLQLLMWSLAWLNQLPASHVIVTLSDASVLLLCVGGLLLTLTPRGLGCRILALPMLIPAIAFNASVLPDYSRTEVSSLDQALNDTPSVHSDHDDEHRSRMPDDLRSAASADTSLQVHILDVGQGLAVLVYSGAHTLLFDTGGRLSPSQTMIEAVVLPFLQATGRRRIDTLIVSHGDDDHAAGLDDVLAYSPAADIIAGPSVDIKRYPQAHRCQAGDSFFHNGTGFAFLHPSYHDQGSDNNLSCVLLIYVHNKRIVLTGDIEVAAERQLIQRLGNDHSLAPVTLMSAPHHGSRSSSSEALLRLLQPQQVVFSAAADNRYAFPHSDVQLRYQSVGAMAHTTGQTGTLSFYFNDRVSDTDRASLQQPVTWWQRHRRFWHGIVDNHCRKVLNATANPMTLIQRFTIFQKGQTLCGK